MCMELHAPSHYPLSLFRAVMHDNTGPHGEQTQVGSKIICMHFNIYLACLKKRGGKHKTILAPKAAASLIALSLAAN